jgi:hypothetical protein
MRAKARRNAAYLAIEAEQRPGDGRREKAQEDVEFGHDVPELSISETR